MKTPDSTSLASMMPSVPSLFQIAAFFDDFFPRGELKQMASPLRQLPFAHVMISPEKLLTLLKSGKTDAYAVTTAPEKTPLASPVASTKRGARNAAQKKSPAPGGSDGNGDNGSGNGSGPASAKKVEFTFKSPTAKSVKLAGDFTNWEKSPIEMMSSGNGRWFTVVPLEKGIYSYRFIVDGGWHNDPQATHRVPNPFGTENAIIQVS